MARLDIAPGESLFHEYHSPGAAGATFVFVNALTGSTGTWEHAEIGPQLRAAGYGTLAWNFRGQAQTAFGANTRLAPDLIVEDLQRVVAHVKPPKPILVGLSIGGLFAAQAVLAGMPAAALVLINTLRKPGVRLDWINRASATLARLGGTRLVMEANLPQLVNPGQLVVFKNIDGVGHDPTFDGTTTSTGIIAPGQTSQPIAIGTAKSYHCGIHPSMVGSFNGNETPEPPPCTGYCG